MLPRVFLVQRAIREIPDTVTLMLAPQEQAAPVFRPGQFNMLYAFGVGEVAISLSGDPQAPEFVIHTVRAVGAVSRALAAARPGQALGVRGPFGSEWPVADAEGSDLVIVAGGIGLAPLRPAIYHVLAHRERYGRVVLLYGARTPQDLLYPRQLEKWGGRFDVELAVTVDSATAAWRGNVGVVTSLLSRATFAAEDTVAMVCGPEVMMRFTVAELRKRGVYRESIYLSMERNMKCAVGFCGRCQLGPAFVCKNGPVFHYPDIEPFFRIREV